MSHISYWDQFNSGKSFWKLLNGSLRRNRPLAPISRYSISQTFNTEACAKELCQILAKNIDNGGRGIGLRIFVRYYLKKQMKSKKRLGKTLHFFQVQLAIIYFCDMPNGFKANWVSPLSLWLLIILRCRNYKKIQWIFIIKN